VLSIAAVMAVSFEVLRRSRMQVVKDFDASQTLLAREVSTVLAARLSAFDRDGRLLADLVERTRREAEGSRTWQDREILAACQALATTVSHYRTIGVFGRAGLDPIVAVDPTEDRIRTVPVLVKASEPLALDVSKSHRAAWRGPLTVAPDRAFYLYATPAGDAEAVVVTVDVGLLLQDALRKPPPDAKFIVADAASVIWMDCETRATCRRGELEPSTVRAAMRGFESPGRIGGRGRQLAIEAPPSASIDRLTPAAAAVQVLGSGADTMLATTQSVTTPLGVWSLILRSSTSHIDAAQRGLIWQLLLTSAGVIAVMLSVGAVIVKQQRTAATLEVQLKAARQLADLRERSDKILDNVSVGVMGANRRGMVVFANRFFKNRAFPLPQQPGDVDQETALADWTSRLRPHIERAVVAGRTGLISSDSQALRSATDPAYDVRVVPLSHPVDGVDALVLVEDLSALHQLRHQLIRAEKLITVGVLSAGLAHEVGTPLMVIRGHAEFLLEKIGGSPAAQHLQAIVEQIDHISATIRRVLDFSRGQPMQVTPTDVRHAVSRAVELLTWRLRTKHISVVTPSSTNGELPPLAADPLQLEQVLVNLLMNAYDASFEGQVLEVCYAVQPKVDAGEPDRVRIDIVDHGAGIRAEDVNAVFDPYFTTKKSGEGTGLGLTIVSQIVQNHQGEVSIHKTPGGGTKVTLSWPSAAEPT